MGALNRELVGRGDKGQASEPGNSKRVLRHLPPWRCRVLRALSSFCSGVQKVAQGESERNYLRHPTVMGFFGLLVLLIGAPCLFSTRRGPSRTRSNGRQRKDATPRSGPSYRPYKPLRQPVLFWTQRRY